MNRRLNSSMVIYPARDSNSKTEIEAHRPEAIDLVGIDPRKVEVETHVQFPVGRLVGLPVQATTDDHGARDGARPGAARTVVLPVPRRRMSARG